MNEATRLHDDELLLREDEIARRDALDATRSFLVQAPAGSGKTELLIQRLLALLARVDEPERILALTFTRKAAGEMRERVVEALSAAARQEPLDPDQPHLAVTRELAHAVLAQDARRGWALSLHPARLRIMTFDALTTWIVRNAPFAAGLGPAPGYAEDANGLYAEAAAAAIVDAPADDAHWRRLLVHLHNDADQAARLIAGLLARRDQLLREVGMAGPDAVREALLTALRDEVDSALGALARAFPADLAPELGRLARFAAGELPPDDPLAQGLLACADCGGLPAFTAERLPWWRTLSAWLLTNGGEVRKALDRRQGFPAAGSGPGKAERVAAKQDMVALLDRLRALPGLAETLHGVATMPAPAVPGAPAWEVVEALLDVVPRAVAQLAVAFARGGEVDFSQASLAALDALGTPDAPTDLLQRLDYRLMHLLVDEFQDTSATQLELLRRLTSGWTPGEDDRTLFAVGDPMQSIYRFREAEVRLFVEAQLAAAVAGIPVTCLTLRRNFRSQRAIVEWVNRVFPSVLGEVSDPVRGAVAFAPATAVKDSPDGIGVTFELHANDRDEAQAVVARVREAIDSAGRRRRDPGAGAHAPRGDPAGVARCRHRVHRGRARQAWPAAGRTGPAVPHARAAAAGRPSRLARGAARAVVRTRARRPRRALRRRGSAAAARGTRRGVRGRGALRRRQATPGAGLADPRRGAGGAWPCVGRGAGAWRMARARRTRVPRRCARPRYRRALLRRARSA